MPVHMDSYLWDKTWGLEKVELALLVMDEYDRRIEAPLNSEHLHETRDRRAMYLEIFHTRIEALIRDSCSS